MYVGIGGVQFEGTPELREGLAKSAVLPQEGTLLEMGRHRVRGQIDPQILPVDRLRLHQITSTVMRNASVQRFQRVRHVRNIGNSGPAAARRSHKPHVGTSFE